MVRYTIILWVRSYLGTILKVFKGSALLFDVPGHDGSRRREAPWGSLARYRGERCSIPARHMPARKSIHPTGSRSRRWRARGQRFRSDKPRRRTRSRLVSSDGTDESRMPLQYKVSNELTVIDVHHICFTIPNEIVAFCWETLGQIRVHFMSSSSSLCSCSFTFQSSDFSSSTISNRLA